eukprot:12389553-Ditylum_brightwellii.AAC.1
MLLGFLDLPWSRSFGTYGFAKVETALGDVLEEVTEEAMTEALEEEIWLTFEKKEKSGLLCLRKRRSKSQSQ